MKTYSYPNIVTSWAGSTEVKLKKASPWKTLKKKCLRRGSRNLSPLGRKSSKKSRKSLLLKIYFRVFGSFSNLFRVFFGAGANRTPPEPLFRFFSEFSGERPFYQPRTGAVLDVLRSQNRCQFAPVFAQGQCKNRCYQHRFLHLQPSGPEETD